MLHRGLSPVYSYVACGNSYLTRELFIRRGMSILLPSQLDRLGISERAASIGTAGEVVHGADGRIRVNHPDKHTLSDAHVCFVRVKDL